MAAKDKEVKRLLDEIHNQVQQYQNLVEIKTALDMEIAVYKQLLESEESRLGIPVSGDGIPYLGEWGSFTELGTSGIF